MNIKNAMKYYFNNLLESYSKKVPSYPMTSYREEVDDLIYIGEPDEYEWIRWKPVIKENHTDFEEVNNLLGIKTHPSVNEFYNSYWFFNINGKLGGYVIQLDEVLPFIELKSYTFKMFSYKEAHNGLVEDIPIGIETSQSLLIVVDNISGVVKLEDYEIGSFVTISDSLSDLIIALSES